MNTKILLTGPPGSGKTTIIRKVLSHIDQPVGGFYTQEIRMGGRRHGFELITLDGERGTLAHVDIKSPHQISRYGVDLNIIQTLGVKAILNALSKGKITVIDEIGPMELLSQAFRSAILQALLQTQTTILGTIMKRSSPFTDQIKLMQGLQIFEINRGIRDDLPAEILRRIRPNSHPGDS